MPMKWRFAWTLLLALVATPAFALGLGQIQVRSQYGEPFLAEIPIVSSDPAELRQLQARLASPETFSRVGLQPPQGLVRELQFSVALDASGNPVIRVSGSAPVEQPLLTFLIEADWGQGRLVREYSALLDAPDAIAAPAQPPIQAPLAEAGDRIVRPPVQPPPAQAADAAEAPTDATPVAAAAGPEDPEPLQPEAPPPPPAPVSAPAAAPVAAAARPRPGEYGPVQAGDTLSQIAQRLAREDEVSTNQMMLALLRANPGAFIGGNINLLREGTILRMPERDEAQRLSATEASAEVRAQVARWREMSAPQAQPAGLAEDAGGASESDAATAAGPVPRTASARLEIAPAVADGRQPGTRSGITAGGEGEMLRQELQETRETLAARDAEVEELKARLAELEQIQGQQQQLISLKDSELAAVQQRLAESSAEQTGELAQAGTPVPPAADTGTPWLWIGLGVVLLIAAAAAWARARRSPGTSAGGAGGRPTPAWHAAGDPVPEPVVEAPSADGAAPETAAGDPQPMGAGPGADEPAAAATLLAGAGERLELARAYVELGDVETARSLLQEVADGDAGPERDEAARLLRELA